jgi:hypothetical protein
MFLKNFTKSVEIIIFVFSKYNLFIALILSDCDKSPWIKAGKILSNLIVKIKINIFQIKGLI